MIQQNNKSLDITDDDVDDDDDWTSPELGLRPNKNVCVADMV